VTGNASGTALTVTQAAQTAITSVGTLTGLTVTGATSLNEAVIINEAGADKDFRVEGSGQANALFVQGSDGNVGIGTSAPLQQLHIGSAAANTTARMALNSGAGSDASIDMYKNQGTWGSAPATGFRILYDGGDNTFNIQSGDDATTNTRLTIERDSGLVTVGGDLTVSGNDLDFAAGGANIGASVGANNLTLGGATSTVVSAGDLEVQGQAVLDDSTITIGAEGAQNIAVTKSFHKITPHANNNSITLITGGETGSILVLMHSGANGATLTLTNDGTSDTAHALALDGGNITLADNSTATLIYNGNNWSLISKMINS
jgi:hypothetical protein